MKWKVIFLSFHISKYKCEKTFIFYWLKKAKEAGKVLREQGFYFDIAFTSVLKRAEDTLDYILKEMGEENIEIKRRWYYSNSRK